MNDELEPTDLPEPGADPTVDRLRAMGSHPPLELVRRSHLAAMTDAAQPAAAAPVPREKRFGRLAVAMAAVVGFLVGSTGFAMAGALPDPAQDAASDVLAVVGLDVPKGKDGKRGPCVSAAAKETDPVAKQAAKDACPKGPFGNGPGDEGVEGDPGERGRSGEAPGRANKPEKTTPPGQVGKADDPCKGKPAWAGNNDLTDDEVAAAKAAREACPPDVDDDAEPEADSDDVEVEAGG